MDRDVRRFWKVLALSTVSLTIALAPAAADEPPASPIRWDSLTEGQILATGMPSGDACSFPSISISIEAPQDVEARGAALDIGEGCSLFVSSIWEGTAVAEPIDLPESAEEVLITPLIPESSLPATLGQEVNCLFQQGAQPESVGCTGEGSSCGVGGNDNGEARSFTERYWNYGWGDPDGTSEVLTEIFADTTFCSNGSEVAIIKTAGQCRTKWATGWHLDGCERGAQDTYDTTTAYWQAVGRWHWKHSSDFDHQLWVQPQAHPNGVGECVFWLVGSVVRGPALECLSTTPS